MASKTKKTISVSKRNLETYRETIRIVGEGRFTEAIFFSLRRCIRDGSLRDANIRETKDEGGWVSRERLARGGSG